MERVSGENQAGGKTSREKFIAHFVRSPLGERVQEHEHAGPIIGAAPSRR